LTYLLLNKICDLLLDEYNVDNNIQNHLIKEKSYMEKMLVKKIQITPFLMAVIITFSKGNSSLT